MRLEALKVAPPGVRQEGIADPLVDALVMVRRALLLLAYALATGAFFEGTARLALSNDAFFRRVAGEDESSWRLRWVARHRKQRRIYFEFDVHHPTRGWALRPGIRDMKVFGGKVLNSNSRGLRGRREYTYDKPEGIARILVLGDSFTFGEEVSDDETYSHYLEKIMPGTEVLNLGVHGYGHDQMLLYLQEEGLKYHPDAVVLGFVSDDMERNLLAFRDYAKPRYVLEDGRLVLKRAVVPPPDEVMASEVYRSKFMDLLVMLGGTYRWRSGTRGEETRRLTVALLDELNATTIRAGARAAFAYLPVYGEITKADMAMTSRERFFFTYCRQRGIQSMYLRRFFLKRMKEGTDFKAYGHWGPEEHRTVAEGIKAYLLEKHVIQPPSDERRRPSHATRGRLREPIPRTRR